MFLAHASDNRTDIHHVNFSVGNELFFSSLDFVDLEVARDANFDYTIIFAEDIVNNKLTFHQLFLRVLVFFLHFIPQENWQVLRVRVESREEVENASLLFFAEQRPFFGIVIDSSIGESNRGNVTGELGSFIEKAFDAFDLNTRDIHHEWYNWVQT